MRLAVKWFLWFIGIGVYVMFLGGIFYYNLFKWTFDEKLKQDSINLVRNYAPVLQKGLDRNPHAITFDELDIMGQINNDRRIADLLYLNKDGTIRWHKSPELLMLTWDDYVAKMGAPKTDAIKQAFLSKAPKVRAHPDGNLYEVAIPLSIRGDVAGIVSMLVSREGVEAVIQSAMNKYMLGAAGVLFLLGLPLFFFMHHFILTPLNMFRDSIEAVSLKNMDLKFPARKDEIGEVAGALSALLARMKGELELVQSRERQRSEAEQGWWAHILRTMVAARSEAIVMDENNSVLYTTFPLKAGNEADPAQRVHLLDVVDSQQQELLRLVGQALEQPNTLLEGETVFRDEPRHVRVTHLSGAGDHRRTLILFEPKGDKSSPGGALSPGLGAGLSL